MALPNGNMEVVISFDTTGSMGSCLEEVRGRVSDMVQRLQADIPGIKIAIIAHGDYCDAYVTKFVDLTDNIKTLVDFVQNVERTGGGDADECYELVLYEVRTKLSWTPGTQRALVMIGDSNPHKPNYNLNTLKLDWRVEADNLKDIGVRIYSVQCKSYSNSDAFYKSLAKRTDGRYLKLQDFKNVFDLLMAVCYREGGDDLFHAYEKEVRARGEAINKDLDSLFGNLRNKEPSVSAPVATTSTSAAKRPSPAKPFKLTKTLTPTLPLKAGMKRVKRSKKVGKEFSKYVDCNLPKLRRENVPECNFMLREMKWSSWQQVIAPDQQPELDITQKRRGDNHGFRATQIFRGKTKVPALYEVAVQTKYRGRFHVLYSKSCRAGFNGTKNWERCLFSKPGLRTQLDKVVEKKCCVFVRRVLVKGDKTKVEVKRSLVKYDYAWKRIRAVRKDHRLVTKTDVDISEPMES